MPTYRTEAIVLRTVQLGEADRIITLLSKDRGKIRAVAKGVRRTRSKFGSRLEPFSRVDLLLHAGRNLDLVTQAESISGYGVELAGDFERWTAGQSILELADRLASEEGAPVEQQYLLLVAALGALARQQHDTLLVLDAYLLRALSLAGYEPALRACTMCGTVEEQFFFHVPSGGVLCAADRQPGSVSPKPQTLDLLRALLSGDWETAEQADDSARRECAGIVAAHTQWHLERSLRSLSLVER